MLQMLLLRNKLRQTLSGLARNSDLRNVFRTLYMYKLLKHYRGQVHSARLLFFFQFAVDL